MDRSPENASIVLIGPTCSGKSTVGQVLADKLEWSFVELDEQRSTWYPEFGLSPDDERVAFERGGLPELVHTWKPYELLSVERVMQEHPAHTVIAFGGGQAVYVDPEQIRRAKAALAAASRVILLQPADTPAQSLPILQERLYHVQFVQEQHTAEEFVRDFTPILKMQLQSESMPQFATELIVTGQSTPEELANHILATAQG